MRTSRGKVTQQVEYQIGRVAGVTDRLNRRFVTDG
jgi:hypothetical protein